MRQFRHNYRNNGEKIGRQLRDSWEQGSKVLVEDTVGDNWGTARREVGDKGGRLQMRDRLGDNRRETRWETK